MLICEIHQMSIFRQIDAQFILNIPTIHLLIIALIHSQSTRYLHTLLERVSQCVELKITCERRACVC